MSLKDQLQFVRYFGDAEKNYAVNMMKTIAEATEGRIAFPSTMIARVQSAHDTLELYKKKKATEKQILDVFASVGLAFYQWISATERQVQIEAIEGAVEDPLGSLDNPEAKEAAVEATINQDSDGAHLLKVSDRQGSWNVESVREYKERAEAYRAQFPGDPEDIPAAEDVENLFSIKKKQ